MQDNPLSELKNCDIENVYLYVSDATRWDLCPKRITNTGVSIKTVATGFYTPIGLTSILTGCFGENHGSVDWNSKPYIGSLPEGIASLFDIDELNSYFNEDWALWGDSPAEYSVESMVEPFLFVEHSHGGHAPYFSPEFKPSEDLPDIDDDLKEWVATYRANLDDSASETFRRLSKATIRDAYLEKLEADLSLFTHRVNRIQQSNLSNNTLIVFTSDHGELLGEHGGFVGHTAPAAPEVAYVPTVFIHPELGNESVEDEIISIVDIKPTIIDTLSCNPGSVTHDGRSLSSGQKIFREFAPCLGYVSIPNDFFDNALLNRALQQLNPIVHTNSLWSTKGGYSWRECNFYKSFLTGLYDSIYSSETAAFNNGESAIKRVSNLLPRYLASSRSFEHPQIGLREAMDRYDELTSGEITKSDRQEVSQETLDRLNDLGYR